MVRHEIEAEVLCLFTQAGLDPAADGGPSSTRPAWPAFERDLTSREADWWVVAGEKLGIDLVSSYSHPWEECGCQGDYISSANPLYKLLNFLAGAEEDEDEEAVRSGLELLRQAVVAKKAIA